MRTRSLCFTVCAHVVSPCECAQVVCVSVCSTCIMLTVLVLCYGKGLFVSVWKKSTKSTLLLLPLSLLLLFHTRGREEATNGLLLQHRPCASCSPCLASKCQLSQRAIKLVPHASLSLHTQAHTHTHMRVCAHMWVEFWSESNLCTYTRVCTHTHTHTYACTHSHTHTCACTHSHTLITHKYTKFSSFFFYNNYEYGSTMTFRSV